MEYVHYRCLNGIPDQDTYKLFLSEERREQFKNEEVLRLFIILSLTKSKAFLSSQKSLEGLEKRWKQLRKEKKISLLESMKLHFVIYKASVEESIYKHLLHPVRIMLSGMNR